MALIDRELAEALNKAGNSSLLINIISRRVRQLHQGARPLIENADGLAAPEIAIREYAQGKIGYREIKSK